MLNIAIAGCTGRMGRSIIGAVRGASGCKLVGGSIRPGSDEAQARALLAAYGAADLPLADGPQALFAKADAVIDFTSAAYSAALAAEAGRQRKIHIIGTTWFSEAETATITDAAKAARIVQSANFSPGVNVMEALVEKAAALLGDNYDIEIDEMHHALKKDAPSGTALLLGRAAARGRRIELETHRVHYEGGITGPRPRGAIGFSVRRGGEVVGVHTVTLAGPGENLELTHRAFSRDIYADGAIKAALWAAHQKPGLYSMRDVLGI